MRTSAGVTYLHGDHLGSTSIASNASGALVARQTYFPYGAPRTSEGALPTDYTFTGQRADASAGLMFYNARYYDAAIGRFTQPDTIVPGALNPQALNRYSYVYNNPLKYTDPTGHVGCQSYDDGECADPPPPPPLEPPIDPIAPPMSPVDPSPSPVPAPTPGLPVYYPPLPTPTPTLSYNPAPTPIAIPKLTPGTPIGTPPAIPKPTPEPAQQLQVVVPPEAMRYLLPSSLENGRWDWIWPGARSGGGTAGDR